MALRRRVTAAALAAIAATAGTGQGQQPAGEILVSLSGEDRVVSLRPDTGAMLRSFPTGPGPHEIAVSPDRRLAYVANSGSAQDGPRPRTLSVLDLAAGMARPPLDLGRFEQPHDVRVSRDGSTVWAAAAPSRAVVEVNAARPGIVRAWETGADGGWFVEVTPDERKIYVPHLEGKRVTVFDRTTGGRNTVYEGGAQSGIAVSPDGLEVWVIDHERRRVNVIATASDEVVAVIDLASADFGRLVFTPDGGHVAIVQGRRLGWIARATRREIATVDLPLAGKVPSMAPDGRGMVVSNPADGHVTIVTLPDLRVAASYPVGRLPDGVAWVR